MRPDAADTDHHTRHKGAWDNCPKAATDNGEYDPETTDCTQLVDCKS